MFRHVLLLGLLLGAVHCEVELREVEHTEAEGVSQQSYVLVDTDSDGNDQVVGYVAHIQTDGQQLQGSLPRRFGPGFGFGMGNFGPSMMDGIRSFLDQQLSVPEQILGQMGQTRCAMMRQQANDDFTLLNQQLGIRLAPMFLDAYRLSDSEVQQLSADGELASLLGEGEAEPLFGQSQPGFPGMLLGGEEEQLLMPPFQLKPVTWHRQAWEGVPHHYVGGMPHQHHHEAHSDGWHGWMHEDVEEEEEYGDYEEFRREFDEYAEGPYTSDWMPLEDTATPTLGNDSINWGLYDEDGNLNLGLIGFVVLSGACVGVWVAGMASWLAYWRHLRSPRGRSQFVTQKAAGGDLLSPLVHEGPLDSPKLYAGVEFAADHAPNNPKYGTLHYQPLKGDA